MIQERNLICAGSLLRLQIDTALRFYAAFLVNDPHQFAISILEGTEVRRLRDQDGKKMTDAYLVERLSKEFDWMARVYKEASGYIHLSNKHLLSAFTISDADKGSFEVKVSPIDKPLSDDVYIEAIEAFSAATQVFMRYLHGWGFTKHNPDVVAANRERDDRNVT
jgi:hypothetical protein